MGLICVPWNRLYCKMLLKINAVSRRWRRVLNAWGTYQSSIPLNLETLRAFRKPASRASNTTIYSIVLSPGCLLNRQLLMDLKTLSSAVLKLLYRTDGSLLKDEHFGNILIWANAPQGHSVREMCVQPSVKVSCYFYKRFIIFIDFESRPLLFYYARSFKTNLKGS